MKNKRRYTSRDTPGRRQSESDKWGRGPMETWRRYETRRRRGIVINGGKGDNGYEKRWAGNWTGIGGPLHIFHWLFTGNTRLKFMLQTDRQYSRTVFRVSYWVRTLLIFFLSLILWRRNYFFLILAHPVYKMWIIQGPNKLALWNKLHFEEKKRWV